MNEACVVPCGCDLAERAEATRDPRGRAALQNDARHYQRRWSCPLAGHAPAPLDAECQESCANAARVVGCEADEITRCPGHYTRTRDAGIAAELYMWWLRGQLGMVMPHPPGTVTDALSALHTGVEAAKADALRRLREEHEREKER